MTNSGKIFENNWKLSVPSDIFYYRFRDSATSWSNNGMTRFTITNIADCILMSESKGLLLIELKSIKGKSIPLAKIIGNKSKIKQLDDLYLADKFRSVSGLIIVFFSELERCFSISVDKFFFFLKNNDRKSIPVEFFEENGKEISVTKLRTNYRYDISNWLSNL